MEENKKTGENNEQSINQKRDEEDKKQASCSNAWGGEEDFDSDEGDDEFGLDTKP